MPKKYLIAGPNGSGKSTTADVLLSKHLACTELVNADDIKPEKYKNSIASALGRNEQLSQLVAGGFATSASLP